MEPISEHEVNEAIRSSHEDKAAGPSGLTFRVLRRAIDNPEVLTHITTIFNACFASGYCPRAFRDSITVVLRKSGKKDYQDPKAFRPIALLDTLGKALEKVVATRMSYLMEEHGLLPGLHAGGRKTTSSENAIHMVMETISAAWKSSKDFVVSMLMLDVSGAFDNVNHQRLLHNLRKRRIPSQIIKWISSFIKNRSTTIRLTEGDSDKYDIQTGIPQGSPISPILYLFYNADLADICSGEGHVSPMYIDDVNVLVRGPDAQTNCRTVEALHPKLKDWADKHASVFAPEKFKLMHFSKPTRRNKGNAANDMSASCNIEGNTLEPKDSARLLGITLDSQLSWKPHLQNIEANATSKIAAIRSLGNSAWGLEMQAVRKLYRAVVVPSILFCCSAWYTPGATDYKGTQNKILKTLRGIQKRAAVAISGAYKSVAYDSLNILCHLQPIEHTLEQHAADALLRLKSSPNYTVIETLRNDIRNPRTQRQMDDYRSPLEIHEQRLERVWGPHNLEKRQPYIQAPWQKPVPTSIAPNDNEAVAEHNRKANHSLCIYTDGSGLDGQVGAAMVVPCLNIKRGKYMGPETAATVYTAELTGLVLAMEEIRRFNEPQRITIFTDNQAAIQAVGRPTCHSGQGIVKDILTRIRSLQRAGYGIEICWIPAHIGVPGNEAADREAKQASKSWNEHGLATERVTYTSACKRQFRTCLKRRWKNHWECTGSGRHGIFRFYNTPTRHILKLFTYQKRHISSLIAQMLTNKIGLASYLYPWASDTDECPCGAGPMTVHHVLKCCEQFTDIRLEWKGAARSTREIFADPVLATQAARFIHRTGLLAQFSAINHDQVDLKDTSTTCS